jgi:hypothetical protein
MSKPDYNYRIGTAEPEIVLAIKPNGTIHMRAASGELVEVKLPPKDEKRLRALTGGDEGLLGLVRVLCEIVVRQFPAQRPS